MGETVLVGDPPVPGTLDGSTRLTLGSRAKSRAGILDYRAEVGIQLGDAGADRSIFAWQADLELGLNLIDHRLRVGLEALYASGDDPDTDDVDEAWNQLFPTAHKWLGYADVIGPRTNVASGVLHLSFAPAEGWKLDADGHLFFRPEDTLVESGMAGVEGDFGGAYALAEGLLVRTNYSLFVPNEERYGTSDAVHFWELELRYDR